MSEIQNAYDELYVYTMGRPRFILQHVVDAHAAQTVTAAGKPIGIVFALVGLYLHVEKGLTGRQVQQAHEHLGRRKRQWPAIALPDDRGAMTELDVIAMPGGIQRDAAIDRWCEAVWKQFGASRDVIVSLLADEGLA
jgi:Family of unknown function (DUF5946)